MHVSDARFYCDVAGKGGSTIRSLQEKYSVKINIDRKASTVSVQGEVGIHFSEAVTDVKNRLDEGIVVIASDKTSTQIIRLSTPHETLLRLS